MRLKVLIKLSSLFLLAACAEPTSTSSGAAKEIQPPTTSIADNATDPYATYNCASIPSRDWLNDSNKSKAFLKMVIAELNNLNINGNYWGFDERKSECELSINTDSDQLDIYTGNNKVVELSNHKDYIVQGFSCNDSKVRYDLIFENTINGSTKYLSLSFSPTTNSLNKVFFNTESIDTNNSIFECNYLTLASF